MSHDQMGIEPPVFSTKLEAEEFAVGTIDVIYMVVMALCGLHPDSLSAVSRFAVALENFANDFERVRGISPARVLAARIVIERLKEVGSAGSAQTPFLRLLQGGKTDGPDDAA